MKRERVNGYKEANRRVSTAAHAAVIESLKSRIEIEGRIESRRQRLAGRTGVAAEEERVAEHTAARAAVEPSSHIVVPHRPTMIIDATKCFEC